MSRLIAAGFLGENVPQPLGLVSMILRRYVDLLLFLNYAAGLISWVLGITCCNP